MKYLIRSVKYFFRFVLLLAVILLVLIMIGAAEGGIDDIFEEGYYSLLKIAGLFAVIAAAYPKVAFIRRMVLVEDDWETVKNSVTAYLEKHRYSIETDDGHTITYRLTSTKERMSQMWEDRITLSKDDEEEGLYVLEGPRKAVWPCATEVEEELDPRPQGEE